MRRGVSPVDAQATLAPVCRGFERRAGGVDIPFFDHTFPHPPTHQYLRHCPTQHPRGNTASLRRQAHLRNQMRCRQCFRRRQVWPQSPPTTRCGGGCCRSPKRRACPSRGQASPRQARQRQHLFLAHQWVVTQTMRPRCCLRATAPCRLARPRRRASSRSPRDTRCPKRRPRRHPSAHPSS